MTRIRLPGRPPATPAAQRDSPRLAQLPRDSSDSAREALHELHRRSCTPGLRGEIPLPSQLGGTEGTSHTAQAKQVPGVGPRAVGDPGAGLPVTSSDAERSPRPRSPIPRPGSPPAAPQVSANQNGARRPQDFIACGVILKAGTPRTQSPALPAPSSGHGQAGAAGAVPARFRKYDPGARAAGEGLARSGRASQRDYMGRRKDPMHVY